MDGSKITPSILGLRSSGSCVSSRVIPGCVWNWCLSGVKSVTVDFGAEITASFSSGRCLLLSGSCWSWTPAVGSGPEAQTVMSSA